MPNPYSSSPGTFVTGQEKITENKIDCILSSIRPFGQNPGYDELQRKALDSWFAVSRTVVLFNLPEDTGNIQRSGLLYVGPDKNPPSIKHMLATLKDRQEEEIVALVNSDIVLGPEVGKIPKVVLANSLGRAWACTSYRYVIDPEVPEWLGSPVDKGLDFFCSTVRIWNDVARQIPGVLTVGRPVWDNWMNSFFHMYINASKYFDITPWVCVLHPRHEEHFRLLATDEGGVEAACKTIIHPGGLPRLKLNLLQ